MLVGLAIFVIVLFLAVSAGLYFYQERMVFVPSREMVMTPAEVGLPYEDVYIEVASGEKINAWFIPADGADKTVLFCHGNAGNISHRISTARFLHDLKVNVLLFDYRGYGRSEGSSSEENVYADAQVAYDWLVREKGLNSSDLFVFGRSLGGAVAIELACRKRCAGLIVESSLTSAPELGQRMFFLVPIRLISRYGFDSISKIGQVTCPVLITHSPDDQVIPYEMGRRLYQEANSPKEFIDLFGDHNDRGYLNSDIYINGLRRFLGVK